MGKVTLVAKLNFEGAVLEFKRLQQIHGSANSACQVTLTELVVSRSPDRDQITIKATYLNMGSPTPVSLEAEFYEGWASTIAVGNIGAGETQQLTIGFDNLFVEKSVPISLKLTWESSAPKHSHWFRFEVSPNGEIRIQDQ